MRESLLPGPDDTDDEHDSALQPLPAPPPKYANTVRWRRVGGVLMHRRSIITFFLTMMADADLLTRPFLVSLGLFEIANSGPSTTKELRGDKGETLSLLALMETADLVDLAVIASASSKLLPSMGRHGKEGAALLSRSSVSGSNGSEVRDASFLEVIAGREAEEASGLGVAAEKADEREVGMNCVTAKGGVRSAGPEGRSTVSAFGLIAVNTAEHWCLGTGLVRTSALVTGAGTAKG